MAQRFTLSSHLVVLTRQPSKQIQNLLVLRHQSRSSPPARVRQYKRHIRLSAERKSELITAYLSGAATTELAHLFGIHRGTANKLLRAAGVLRPSAKLTRAQADEAVRLREGGWLYREIAEKFNVDTETARRYVLRPSPTSPGEPGE
jgi:hypothetical protein